MLRKNMNPKDIIAELAEVYHDDTLKKTAVYYWICQIRMGRKDLSDEPSPGRLIDVSIDDFIIKQLNIDQYSTAKMIARKAGIALGTVLTHLKKSLNMKNVHLQWIPHMLNEEQKRQRVAYSKEMIKILHRAHKNNFHFKLSGDEAWFEYHYDPSHIEDRNQIVNKAHKSRKTMVTIFFNIDRLQLLDMQTKRHLNKRRLLYRKHNFTS